MGVYYFNMILRPLVQQVRMYKGIFKQIEKILYIYTVVLDHPGETALLVTRSHGDGHNNDISNLYSYGGGAATRGTAKSGRCR